MKGVGGSCVKGGGGITHKLSDNRGEGVFKDQDRAWPADYKKIIRS